MPAETVDEAIHLMNAEEVASALRMGVKRVRSLAASRRIGHYRIGREYRFAAADVAAYLESTRAHGQGPS
jgi:excisionase family DNA binding protein